MIIRGGEVALPGKNLPEVVDIRVTGGKITQIGTGLTPAQGEERIDAGGMLVLPGCIDPHVHFNDPGYTEREDFSHGTAAAAAGGVTTVIDMPCTSVPPVTSLQHLNEKLQVIGPQARIDYGLYGGVSGGMVPETYQENMRALSGLVCGFKCYLISGMESFPRVDAYQLHAVMREAADLNIPILLHAEDFEYVYAATQEAVLEGSDAIHYYHSRPELAEILGIRAAVAIAHETGAQLHIVHVGTARAIECNPGSSVTFETGPHYLAFSHEDFSRIGAPLKTTPPVRPL